MKNFRLEVPEGQTTCRLCPFYTSNVSKTNNSDYICSWLSENNICNKYDFSKLHIWDDI